MVFDIKTYSPQKLGKLFNPLDKEKRFVIWIRNFEMTHQIFMSDGYEAIWQRDPAELYESPLLWFDFLAPEDKLIYMKQLEGRHNQGYRDADNNVIYYQIIRPNQTKAYIQCQCFKSVSSTGKYYVVGFAESLPSDIWQEGFDNRNCQSSEARKQIENQVFTLLKKEFGIKKVESSGNDPLSHFIENVIATKGTIFSLRELECIYHLCYGKTAKQIAKLMHLSSRTVETHLDNVRNKINCTNKLELIGQFYRLLPIEH